MAFLAESERGTGWQSSSPFPHIYFRSWHTCRHSFLNFKNIIGASSGMVGFGSAYLEVRSLKTC